MPSSSKKKTIFDKDIASVRKGMERSVVSMFLRNKAALVRNVHRLECDMFADETCSLIFRVIKQYRKKIGLELFLSYAGKRKRKLFGALEKKDYKRKIDKLEKSFVKLAARKVDVEKTELLIDEIVKYGRTDRVAKVMYKYITLVEDGEIEEAEKFLGTEIYKVQQESGNIIIDKGEVLDDLDVRIDKIRELRENPDYIKRSYTGFKQIDRFTGGLWPGELGIIEGGSSIGKSTLLMEFAHYKRLMGGNPLIISIEMPKHQVESRYDARVGGLNYTDKLKKGLISKKEIKLLKSKLKSTGRRGGKLFVASVPQGCTPAIVEQILEEYKLSGNEIDSLFIDYLDLMTTERKMWSEQHLLGELSREIKGIARAWHLPIWTPTQTSGEALDEDMPTESSVGYSRRKFHNADIFIEVLTTQKDLEDGTLTAFLLKCRDGRRNISIKLRPDFEKMRIKEIKHGKR